MKIANIYDKQLQAIEEAEEKVRIAKTNLLEAERELDETLALVESELDENLFDDEGNDPEYIIEVLDDANRWIHIGQKIEKGKGVVYSLDTDSQVKTFKGENAAKGSGIWDQLIKDGYKEGETLRVTNRNRN